MVRLREKEMDTNHCSLFKKTPKCIIKTVVGINSAYPKPCLEVAGTIPSPPLPESVFEDAAQMLAGAR